MSRAEQQTCAGMPLPDDATGNGAFRPDPRVDEGMGLHDDSTRGGVSCSDAQGRDSVRSRDEMIRDGLRCAVDRLEEISRLLLQPAAGPASQGGRTERASSRGEEAGAQTGDLPRAGIEAILQSAIEAASTKHPGIHWTRSGAGALAHAGRAPAPLREVLEVLLDNAAEAMTGRGEVSIAARESGGRLEVEVRDGGCGIAPSRLDDLFRAGRTTKPQGSGFGLFLARKLVEARGGTITFSAVPGGGASFGVVLPLQDAGR